MSASRTNINALPAGTQIDRYTIEGVLGDGGFGITYLARDNSPLNRTVAIKECFPCDFVQRRGDCSVSPLSQSVHDDYRWCISQFLNEARILASIHHPNIVTVHDCFEANSTAYMITAFVSGDTLERRLAQSGARPDPAFLSNLLARLLDGADAIHRKNVLHRDIKPENILIDEADDPVLIDFGSARQSIGARSQSINVIVTPGYAPLEQYYSGGDQGPWTDLYAIGAVCYRAIHGQKPPDAPRRQRQDNIVNLAQTYGRDYDADFLATIDHALLTDERLRPQNARDWLASLSRAQNNSLSQPPLPPEPPPPQPFDHPVNPHPPRQKSLFARLIAILFGARGQPGDNAPASDDNNFPRVGGHCIWFLDGDDPETGRRYHFTWDDLTTSSLIIGRSADDADICVENSTVSRRHARLRCEHGRVFLTDLGSANGTSKGGCPLAPHKETALGDGAPAEGDILTLGQVTLTLSGRMS